MTTPTDLAYYQAAIDYYNSTRLTSKFYPSSTGAATIFDADGLLALRRSTDITRRYYYMFTVAQQLGQGLGYSYSGWNPLVKRVFLGKAFPAGSSALQRSERAFGLTFEFDPPDPQNSSPWHNILYETFIHSFNAGMRAISIHFPFGHPDLYDGLTFGAGMLTPLEWLNGSNRIGLSGYYSTTDPEFSKARVKGFTSAVRKIIEGTLKPVTAGRSGESGINEPCDVLIYYPAAGGWGGYRKLTHDWWLANPGNSAQKDALLTAELDKFVDFISSMKSDDDTKGILSVALDVGSVSGGPDTLPLYRTLPDYQSDVCELADYYVSQRLKARGIPVATESRAVIQRRRASAAFFNPDTTIYGEIGASASTGWKNFSGDENYLWFSDPEITNYYTGANTSGEVFVANGVGDWTHRLTGSYTTFANKLPYGFSPIISYTGVTYDWGLLTSVYKTGASTVYNPFHHLSHIYGCADIYIDYMFRLTGEQGWANRRLLKNFSIYSIDPYLFFGFGLVEGRYTAETPNDYLWWYFSTLQNLNLHPLFRATGPQGWTSTIPPVAVRNGQNQIIGYTGYSGGAWTEQSRTWYNDVIRGASTSGITFGHLLKIFKDLAMNYNPPGRTNPPEYAGSPGFTQWGSTGDYYYINMVDSSIRQV